MAKRKRGRPSTYTPEIAAEVCRRMAEGQSLRQIEAGENMPARSTIVQWALDDRDGFFGHYARAQSVRARLIFEDMLDIADDGTNDFVETKDGPVLDHEHVQRSRLRVDTRKWFLSKLAPKLYGERLALTGYDGGPIKHEMSDAELDARREELEAKLLERGNGKKNGKRKRAKA